MRRHLSEDGSQRFLCVSAREARLLLEAERTQMEMRLGADWRGLSLSLSLSLTLTLTRTLTLTLTLTLTRCGLALSAAPP